MLVILLLLVYNYIYKTFEVAPGSFWYPFHPKTAGPYIEDSSLETASIPNDLIEFVLFCLMCIP